MRIEEMTAEAPGAPAPDPGDYQTVARLLTPTEAHLLRSCLEAGGVPSVVADDNLSQTHSLLVSATGGASLRVLAAFVPQAKALIAAFERGDLALDDDFDPTA